VKPRHESAVQPSPADVGEQKPFSDSARFDDGYLPVKDLAVYSGLCVRTLRNYISHPSHPLPCYRIGGKVLVRRSEFDQWALQFREEPSSVVNSLVTEALRGL
jgi:hypothetical protein